MPTAGVWDKLIWRATALVSLAPEIDAGVAVAAKQNHTQYAQGRM